MINLEMKEKNLEFIYNLKDLSSQISKSNDCNGIDISPNSIVLQRLPDGDLKGLYDASLDNLDDLKEMVKSQKIAINLYRKEVDRRNRERKVSSND
jgi:hypothetical protein